MSPTARRGEPISPRWPGRALRGWAPRRGFIGLLLVIAAGLGCVRTTSIGRAKGAPDAEANGDTRQVDGQAERETGATDRDVTPTEDAHTDTRVDMGPIIGNGRDAGYDAPDGPDDSDADGSDAADDAAAP